MIRLYYVLYYLICKIYIFEYKDYCQLILVNKNFHKIITHLLKFKAYKFIKKWVKDYYIYKKKLNTISYDINNFNQINPNTFSYLIPRYNNILQKIQIYGIDITKVQINIGHKTVWQNFFINANIVTILPFNTGILLYLLNYSVVEIVIYAKCIKSISCRYTFLPDRYSNRICEYKIDFIYRNEYYNIIQYFDNGYLNLNKY